MLCEVFQVDNVPKKFYVKDAHLKNKEGFCLGQMKKDFSCILYMRFSGLCLILKWGPHTLLQNN